MTKPKEPVNPFYVLTAILGVAFTITACGYGLLMVYANRPVANRPLVEPAHPLIRLLDRHGMAILGVEVGLLAVVSVAAILLDHFRGKRRKSQRSEEHEKETKLS